MDWTVEYRVGNVLDVPERPVVLVHVVNNVGAWGAGFSGSLGRRFPEARTTYRNWARDGHVKIKIAGFAEPAVELFGLGKVLFVGLTPRRAVAHLCAQDGVGTDRQRLRYDSLAECLKLLATHLDSVHYQGWLAMPRIGCGLAGGSWDRVEPLLALHLSHYRTVVYDLEKR